MRRLISWLIVACLVGVWIPGLEKISGTIIIICFVGWILATLCGAIGLVAQSISGTRYDQTLNAEFDALMIQEIERRRAGE